MAKTKIVKIKNPYANIKVQTIQKNKGNTPVAGVLKK